MQGQPGDFSGLHGLVNAAASMQQQADLSASKKRKLEQSEDGQQQQQPGFAVGSTSSMPPPSSRSGLMPPPRKKSEDDAWVLPRRGVQQALKAAGLDKDFKLEGGTELQGALMELYGTLIENAVQFGCSNARMRKSPVLKPRDMAVYLERTWGISVPGFAGEQVRAHRRPAVSEVHWRRLTASRQVVNDTLPRRGAGAAAAAQLQQ
ncbi:hypothetical protein DUNSADRAFT_8706 [Dunaliella salina]|uniref:Transcription initiation factor TFIID subunit 12 domain-containing protein n=1 Tax=Dunaliella salina TaxID=3046 RepID=A0ABQ7GIZ7_DUNSA|nr:hypothetical protein DUNSADRAFT_8706 [Dunaliella salina]|eukprot:KAF5834581.1 hypothetical protein DUNSADRAFT_8706 [Dunaliella salina]